MDPVIGQREIECHTFAGPPVYDYQSISAVVHKAISNCTHYIHGDDTVPYLSLHQVRQVDAQLVTLEEQTRKMGFWPSVLIAMGYKTPTPEMVHAVQFGDANAQPVPGGPKLIMPAKQIVWFLLDKEMDEVNFMVCNPTTFADLGIYLCGNSGFNHHVPQEYEYVLNKAEASGWKMKMQE